MKNTQIKHGKKKPDILCEKGKQLLKQYETMANEGYDRTNGSRVENAYNSFELKKASKHVRGLFDELSIKSVLDYGSGGSNWRDPGFSGSLSAIDFFNLDEAFHYEPARCIDERRQVDCVISFDVLEHIFISDIKAVLNEMFSYARKLVVLNVACYEAAASFQMVKTLTSPSGFRIGGKARSIWWLLTSQRSLSVCCVARATLTCQASQYLVTQNGN